MQSPSKQQENNHMGSASPHPDMQRHHWPQPKKTILYQPHQRTEQTDERGPHVHHWTWHELPPQWWWCTQFPLWQWLSGPVWWLLLHPPANIHPQWEHNGHDPGLHQCNAMDHKCVHPRPATWPWQPLSHWTWPKLQWPHRTRRPPRDWPNCLSKQITYINWSKGYKSLPQLGQQWTRGT